MIPYNDFKSRWDSMPVYGHGYLRIDGEHPLDINIGYEEINQKTLLILNAYEINELPSSKSIIPANCKLQDGTWTISFRLVHNDNEEVFMRLCWDIIESSRYIKDNPVAYIIERYLKWQKLMEQSRPDIMSLSMQKGLFGELLYLKELIKDEDEEKAIVCWVGPEGSDQDFILDDTWVEVKSITRSSATVSISSLEQLDVVNDGILLIYKLDKTTIQDTHGQTLVDIIESVRKIISENTKAKEQFELKLYMYGYKENSAYNKIKYKLSDELRYSVTKTFPRIVKENVASQIVFAKYGLSLAAIEPFKM